MSEGDDEGENNPGNLLAIVCSVIGAFTGHGIGSYFHGPPDIFHVKNNYPGVMVPGMTFTVEPILCEGSPEFGVSSTSAKENHY